MKIERALYKYKPAIEKICEDFQLKKPTKVYVMKNWKNKTDVNKGLIKKCVSTDFYIMKIRKFTMVNGNKTLKTDDEIKNIICELLSEFFFEDERTFIKLRMQEKIKDM